MKYLFALSLLAFVGCTPGSEHADDDESSGQDSTNLLLYNQVMDIHNEVMPKMEDLYNLRKDIEDKLKNPAAPAQATQEKLTKKLAEIDSVSKMMMDWMHEFNPPPDSADREETRAYLESEMEKIRVVRQAMLETIAEGSNP